MYYIIMTHYVPNHVSSTLKKFPIHIDRSNTLDVNLFVFFEIFHIPCHSFHKEYDMRIKPTHTTLSVFTNQFNFLEVKVWTKSECANNNLMKDAIYTKMIEKEEN